MNDRRNMLRNVFSTFPQKSYKINLSLFCVRQNASSVFKQDVLTMIHSLSGLKNLLNMRNLKFKISFMLIPLIAVYNLLRVSFLFIINRLEFLNELRPNTERWWKKEAKYLSPLDVNKRETNSICARDRRLKT